MELLEEITKPETIEIIAIDDTQNDWDDNFGDHSICSF